MGLEDGGEGGRDEVVWREWYGSDLTRHEAATQSLLSAAASMASRKRWGGPSGGSVKMEEHGCEIASSCLAVLEGHAVAEVTMNALTHGDR